jgi:hypothetical protein
LGDSPRLVESDSSCMLVKEASMHGQSPFHGIVRANSFTLPKCQYRISRPLIFLHFSGSI